MFINEVHNTDFTVVINMSSYRETCDPEESNRLLNTITLFADTINSKNINPETVRPQDLKDQGGGDLAKLANFFRAERPRWAARQELHTGRDLDSGSILRELISSTHDGNFQPEQEIQSRENLATQARQYISHLVGIFAPGNYRPIG